MEQRESSKDHGTGRKVHLPDTKDSYPIPDKWRLPFQGKLVTPTAVPSASERHLHLEFLEKRRRRNKILIAAAAAAVAVASGVLLYFFGPLKR
jgi:hypothetical protein